MINENIPPEFIVIENDNGYTWIVYDPPSQGSYISGISPWKDIAEITGKYHRDVICDQILK